MAIEAKPDPVAERYRPEGDLLAYAHNEMLEQETPEQRFVRQRYEEAMGALRVVVLALREIYPTDVNHLTREATVAIRSALRSAEEHVEALDWIQKEILGAPMDTVLRGRITTLEQYKEWYGR